MKFPRKVLAVPAFAALMVVALVAMSAPASADVGWGGLMGNHTGPVAVSGSTCTSTTEVVNGVVVSHTSACCSFAFFQSEWVDGRWLGWDGSTWFARAGDRWVGWNGDHWLQGDGTNWWAWSGMSWFAWNDVNQWRFSNDCIPAWNFAGDAD